MKITKCVNKANTTPQKGRTIKYIVIHYTATTSSKGKAKAIANYFSRPTTGASADFIVDDDSVVQYNPDIKNRFCWSVGGAKYKTKSCSTAGTLYGKATNKNSVNIEICSCKKSIKSLNATDRDWYFTESAINNVIKLTRYLMELYEIPAERVIMHNHVTGKLCPTMWSQSESALKEWKEFKARLGYPIKFKMKSNTLLRTSAGGDKVAYKSLPESMREKCEDINGRARIRKNENVTAIDEKRIRGTRWIKIKSGYWIPKRKAKESD